MSLAVSKVRTAKTTMYRSLVVESAERLFAEQGYERTKIQDIAAQSEISLGTLYSVFEGKSDIYAAVHEDRLGELFELSGRAMATDDNASGRLMKGNRVFIRWLTEHPDYLRIHINRGVAWASNPTEGGDDLVNAWKRGIALIAGVVEQAMQEDDLCAGDPTIAARIMVAIQQVFVSTWVESGMKSDADTLADDIEEQLRRSLFRSER